MDKQISLQVLKKRRKRLAITIGSILVIVITLFIILINMFSSSIDIKKVVTSTVDFGSLDITVTASGKIVPMSEEIIPSPVTSKILKVFKQSGEIVITGDSILQLDLTSINADLDKMKNDMEVRVGKLEQFRTNIQRENADLEMQLQIDEMRLKRTEALLKNEIYLDSIGGSTADKVKQVELEYNVQKLQLQQLKLRFERQKSSAEEELKAMELDYSTALKNISLTQKTVSDAQILSPKNATLIWVNDRLGSTVSQGERLAVISDLSSYKVEANISDNYAQKITTGNKVIVRIGQENFYGTVGNVIPSVENGMINFIVILENNNHEKLRSGLKVDVFVIEATKEEVLRIDNRSYYRGPGTYTFWVLDGTKAYKKNILLGESSYEKVEVVEGLNRSEKVILSDMSKYKNSKKLTIK